MYRPIILVRSIKDFPKRLVCRTAGGDLLAALCREIGPAAGNPSRPFVRPPRCRKTVDKPNESEQLGLFRTHRNKFVALLKLLSEERGKIGQIANPIRFGGYRMIQEQGLSRNENYEEIVRWGNRTSALGMLEMFQTMRPELGWTIP